MCVANPGVKVFNEKEDMINLSINNNTDKGQRLIQLLT